MFNKLLYILGIKKRRKGFQFWKGLALVLIDEEYRWIQFEISLPIPIEYGDILERYLKQDASFLINGVRPYDIMVPEKSYWTMTFTVDRRDLM